MLKELDLTHNALTDDAVCIIASGQWPMLEDLDLSHNQPEVDGVKKLVSANWPMLAHLNFAFDRFFALNEVGSLVMYKWPLLCVYLSHPE